MKEIEEIFSILDFNKADYFLTGSRAMDDLNNKIKISNSGSDYDYVLTIHKRHNLINYLNDNKIPIEYSCYNGGFKFNLDGKVVNVITAIDIEFIAWKQALDMIKYMISTNHVTLNAIKIKSYRYAIYEQLRGIIKTFYMIGTKNEK